MKYYLFVLFILSLLTVNIKCQYVTINFYSKYGQLCDNSDDSLASSDDGISPCMMLTTGGYIIKDNYCFLFTNEQVPTKFTANENKTITQQSFEENDINCLGESSSIIHFENDCYTNCKNTSNPLNYRIELLNEIVIPVVTVVQVGYSGNCGSNWKESVVYMQYTKVMQCFDQTLSSSSYYLTCNSTSLTNWFYPAKECFSPTNQFTKTTTLFKPQCSPSSYGNLNTIQFCNMG